jgi:formylglycine-generating enzyme required for sulfatase activity
MKPMKLRIVLAVLVLVAAGALSIDAQGGEKGAAAKGISKDNARAAKTPDGMAKIPAGWFRMGCSPGDSECDYDERPSKRVYLDSFTMDLYETTQKDYEKVMGKNPSDFEDCPDCPVEAVSWYDAGSYCKKVGKRLPTEAEWEYAARGGAKGARNGDLDSIAWYSGNAAGKTHPVGRKQPNAYGLYDMLGNVYEWCEDRYDKDWYIHMSERNPVNRMNTTTHAIRGGSWLLDRGSFRLSNRCGLKPTLKSINVGFRCARN